MNISDLLDPDKMKALDEKFRPASAEDYEKARKALERSARSRIPKSPPQERDTL